MISVGTPVMWVLFTALMLALLAVDLFCLHRKAHEVRMREAVVMSCFWVALALAFGAWVHWEFGATRALEYLAGYVVEKSLSVDNLFVILVIFRTFSVPSALQHRVLFWGIVGALVFRAIFIVAGGLLLQRFEWILYIFGLFLALTGIKLLLQREHEPHPERNPLLKWLKTWLPMTHEFDGQRFFMRQGKRWVGTPLLAALVTVEFTDVIFAADSIPAVYAITNDPFIVYTSNIFAILGLRALYFVLAGAMARFETLKIGLSLVLMFIGAKLLIAPWLHVPIVVSLIVILTLLTGSLIAPWLWRCVTKRA